MRNNSPLVTVGVPTYNRPGGLEKTLQCILAQSYRNLEVIVSDNCSTDETVLPILKKYKALDSRITYFIQEKNLSIVPNFQFLLDKAKGEYFMWAADDDNWDLNFIEVCVQGLQENPDVVLCMTDLKLTGADGVSRGSKLNRSFYTVKYFFKMFSFYKKYGRE